MIHDDDWYERLYERHRPAIAAYCRRRVSAPDAADATAQVFVVAWQRREDVPDGDRALPWLYGVARHVVSHQWRSAGRARRLARRAGSLRAVPAPGPDSHVVDSAEHQLVREAVMSLGDNDREVLLLSAWEGLTHPEIAETLGCSVSAVDKRVARAKTRLARRYDSLVGSEPATEESPMTRSPVRAPKGGGGR